MNQKLGFGVIGCGRISDKHIEGIISNYEQASLVAVSDMVPAKMKQAVSCYEDCLEDNGLGIEPGMGNDGLKEYQDYKDLLMDNRIDVVTIATESGYHAELTLDALHAGKHVIVEKPMALSTTAADRMIELAREEDLVLSVCHQNRFNPTIQRLRSVVEEGGFGRLVHAVASVRWNRDDEYYQMDDWHGTLALDGGILMNQCLHNIDMLRWMMGEVERVYAETDTFLRDIETEDAGLALIRFKNNVLGIIEGTVCVYPENLEETLNIFGEKGTVRVGGIALNKIIDWEFKRPEFNLTKETNNLDYKVDTVYGYGHNLLFKDVITAVINDSEPLVDGREGRKTIALILAIYKSARRGQPVKFPVGKYAVTEEEVR